MFWNLQVCFYVHILGFLGFENILYTYYKIWSIFYNHLVTLMTRDCWSHRYQSNIYCLTAHTACLVGFISTVKAKKEALEYWH
jgi:hypothetical protein